MQNGETQDVLLTGRKKIYRCPSIASGDEKKRICLARALLRSTDALILDEPLANLDGETVRRIEDLLLSIHDWTLLVVSHQFSSEKLEYFTQVVDFSAER